MPSSTFYLVTLVLLLLLVIVGVYLYFSLFKYMKDNHNSLWVELGKPSPSHNTIANNFKCGRFIFLRKYRSSNDPVLIKRCEALLAYSLFTVVVFVLINVFLKPAQFSL